MLQLDSYIDLVIPRGSNQLVRMIRDQSRNIPVLGHADGICHVYVDDSADPEKAFKISMCISTPCFHAAARLLNLSCASLCFSFSTFLYFLPPFGNPSLFYFQSGTVNATTRQPVTLWRPFCFIDRTWNLGFLPTSVLYSRRKE